MRRLYLLALFLLLSPTIATPAGAEMGSVVPGGIQIPGAAGTRLLARSPELPASTPDVVRRVHPAVVPSGGGFGVVWEDARRGLVFSRLDPQGTPRGLETRIAANTQVSVPYEGPVVLHRQPALAPLPGGAMLLVWVEDSAELVVVPFHQQTTHVGSRVLALPLRGNGTAAGPVRVVDERAGRAADPVLVALGDDGLLVGWRYEPPGGVHRALVRPLAVDGAPTGPIRRVDDGGGVGSLALATSPAGGVLTAWSACCDADDEAGIFARPLDRRGRAAAPAVGVNATLAGRQGSVAAVGTDEGFLAAWTHEVGGGEYRLRARPLAVTGQPLAGEVEAGSGVERAESHPRFLRARDGSLQLAWIVWGQTFRIALMAQAVGPNGASLAEPSVITERHPDAQNVFALAAGRDRVVAAWSGFSGRQRALLVRAFSER